MIELIEFKNSWVEFELKTYTIDLSLVQKLYLYLIIYIFINFLIYFQSLKFRFKGINANFETFR